MDPNTDTCYGYQLSNYLRPRTFRLAEYSILADQENQFSPWNPSNDLDMYVQFIWIASYEVRWKCMTGINTGLITNLGDVLIGSVAP